MAMFQLFNSPNAFSFMTQFSESLLPFSLIQIALSKEGLFLSFILWEIETVYEICKQLSYQSMKGEMRVFQLAPEMFKSVALRESDTHTSREPQTRALVQGHSAWSPELLLVIARPGSCCRCRSSHFTHLLRIKTLGWKPRALV